MTHDPRKRNPPNTYFVQEHHNGDELKRLLLQDELVTQAMGGVLAEHPDPTHIEHLLDVACGTGGWLIETARTYPTIPLLVGIDINPRMIEVARTQAETHQVSHRVEFHTRDALLTLAFPTNFFDLVTLRFGVSFLRIWDWPKILQEMRRVCRPGGIIRVTEGEVAPQTTSPALTWLYDVGMCALFRAGHLFEHERTGVTAHLVPLLTQHGVQQLQSRTIRQIYRAGTPACAAFREDVALLFQNARPFLQKWGCAPESYHTLYQQALAEMQDPDFQATGTLVTVWGTER